ncbi:MAG: Ig-like domain-containing protein, partial [Acetatifactor sp.]|nr:Ig-like domain-containing protein [Acetatifactor sp.]
NFSSIEKDLKIKFVNKETGKLIGNVHFSITVTDPDGTSVMWSDDDMDGIIYKKNLKPGEYRLVMNELNDEKYKSYGLVAAEQRTEVKKEIEYKKVDVSDEVKTEAQVNVAKEDTKINETLVESYLQDTVAWVESTSTMIAYTEVSKSNIPDPMTVAMRGSFVRLSQESTEPSASQPSEEPTQPSEEEPAPTEAPIPTEAPATPAPTEAPATPVPTEAPATPAPTEAPVPTEAPATPAPTEAPATPVPTETPAPTVTPTPTAVPAYVGKISPSSKSLGVGESFNVSASCDGVTIQSIIWSSSNSEAVTVDGSGKVTAVAVTQQPVLISYVASGVDAAGNAVSGLTASCSVTVANSTKVLKLDKATEVVYLGTPLTLTATLENAPDTAALTVESSDTNVARAEISGRTVTVTGVAAGTANITVKYTENNNTISAACTVTVKQNPRDNKTSLLKDKEGNELYVLENNDYRPAYYADYYTADKFFKKGEAKYTGWQTIGGAVKYFDINGNAVTGEQVIQGVKYNFASDGALVTGSGTMGIDVSKWNGDIDWNAVKNSGVSYVIIRCGYRGSSQGSLIVDSKFQSNIKGATDAGLKVGIYFFTQAIDRVEAVEEASMVLDLIKNYRISYPVFLDVEASGGRADGISMETRTEVCKAFCQTIQNAGYTAGIYANKTWLTSRMDISQLSAYKIWLAQYASAPTYTGRYDLWQYKSTGRVSGISGDVDLNLSYLGY